LIEVPFRQSKQLRKRGEARAERQTSNQHELAKLSGDCKQRVSNSRHNKGKENGNRVRRVIKPAPECRAYDDATQREDREKDAESKRAQMSLVDCEESQV
jgi:hypothetical protein